MNTCDNSSTVGGQVGRWACEGVGGAEAVLDRQIFGTGFEVSRKLWNEPSILNRDVFS